MPDVIVYMCIEMSPDELAIVYSVAQRKGKDIKTYIRDVLRDDISRSLQQSISSEQVKKDVRQEVK